MITIRKANENDAHELLEYLKVIGSESDNLTFGKEGIPLSLEDEKKYLEEIYDSNEDIYLVALKDNKIVGTSSITSYKRDRLAHRAELSITVLKEMWGQHIGSMLLNGIIDFCTKSKTIEIISLEVRCDNERAISLYKKFGFEIIGTFKG